MLEVLTSNFPMISYVGKCIFSCAYAFACHAPTAFIKAQGDWQSDAYLVYPQFFSVEKLELFKSITSRLCPQP